MSDFNWTVHPESEQLVDELIAQAIERSPQLADLDQTLRKETSTQLINWLDHIAGPVSTEELIDKGFVNGHLTKQGIWRHPGAQLPAIIPGDTFAVGLRVDDVAAFLHAQKSSNKVEGSPRSGFRRAVITEAGAPVAIAGVERRSWSQGIDPQVFTDAEIVASYKAWQLWDEKPRGFKTGSEAVEAVIPVVEQLVQLVGVDLAASYVLELERQYWQRRNTAGIIQHGRQDRFGLGWGNNDHHTFRSSRAAFRQLIRMFNTLGFNSRERFYAGEQAGWGAQVLDHPGCGGVLFVDVDLDPHEVGIDFSTTTLPVSEKLGTIGLWCELHGESILGAGMHHLEGQFEFDALQEDLGSLGISHMKPFSNFPHLRQAFTQAEKWPVDPDHLSALVAAGHIDQTKAAEFASDGAAGSHLENLQRRSGFKGFNQHSVSATMQVTDPRVYKD